MLRLLGDNAIIITDNIISAVIAAYLTVRYITRPTDCRDHRHRGRHRKPNILMRDVSSRTGSGRHRSATVRNPGLRNSRDHGLRDSGPSCAALLPNGRLLVEQGMSEQTQEEPPSAADPQDQSLTASGALGRVQIIDTTAAGLSVGGVAAIKARGAVRAEQVRPARGDRARAPPPGRRDHPRGHPPR